jgi:hypothetical protein
MWVRLVGHGIRTRLATPCIRHTLSSLCIVRKPVHPDGKGWSRPFLVSNRLLAINYLGWFQLPTVDQQLTNVCWVENIRVGRFSVGAVVQFLKSNALLLLTTSSVNLRSGHWGFYPKRSFAVRAFFAIGSIKLPISGESVTWQDFSSKVVLGWGMKLLISLLIIMFI